MVFGCARNTGRRRQNNEDAVYSFNALLDADSKSMPFGLFIVSDGMGGHRNGEIASDAAVRTMAAYVLEKLYTPLFAFESTSPEESFHEILHTAVDKANQAVNRYAPGGGCTLTAVLIIGQKMNIAHVGDSRAYSIFPDGRMQVLTRDHSLVKRLEELGQITPEEAEVHPQKSMLYRALGQGEQYEPDITTATLPHPGYLMICSDGLWSFVAEDDIYQVVTSSISPQRACQDLVDLANAAGGPDNISVMLIRMSE